MKYEVLIHEINLSLSEKLVINTDEFPIENGTVSQMNDLLINVIRDLLISKIIYSFTLLLATARLLATEV